MTKMISWLGYDSKMDYKNRISYIINGASMSLAVFFSVIYIFVMNYERAIPGILLYFGSTILVFELLRRKCFFIAKSLILIGFMMQEISIVFFLFPHETGFNLFFFIVAPITFFVFELGKPSERWMMIIFTLAGVGLLLLSEILPTHPTAYVLPEQVTSLFRMISTLSSILSITIVFYVFAIELSKTQSELKSLADTDGLTSVYNRRFFFEMGIQQMHLAGKYQRSFAMILLDVDHFKEVNDRYGHPVGDRVLIEISTLIRSQIRRGDLLSRYGGEEFALILKDTGIEEGKKIAEKIRVSVQEHDFFREGEKHRKITVSLGVVSNDYSFTAFDEMVKAADAALYKAKNAGRNRSEIGTLPAEPI